MQLTGAVPSGLVKDQGDVRSWSNLFTNKGEMTIHHFGITAREYESDMLASRGIYRPK